MCKQARITTAARAALAATTALATAAALAGPARAGEYHVYSCRTPAGHVAPADGWSEPAHSVNDSTENTCEAGGGLIAGLKDGHTHLADSETDKATWSFLAPKGESISAATLWRAGATAGGSNSKATYLFWLAGDASTGVEAETFDECAASNGCTSEGSFSEPLAAGNRLTVPENALKSDFLSLNTYCGSKLVVEAACPEGKSDPGGYAATIELFAADVVLSQAEGPTVSAVAGSLAEAPTVSGTSDLEFQASDAGSGVYQVVFRVDGNVVSTVVPEEEGGRCRNVGETSDGLPAFLYTQPCPAAVSVDLPFDTTALANGTHDLLVTVLDAAGNAKTVLERKVTVDNTTAPGGSGGNGSGGNGSGANGSGSGGSGSNGSGSGSNGSGASGSGSSGSGASGSGASGVGASGSAGSGANAAGGSSALATAVLGAANGAPASEQATLTAVWRGHTGARLGAAYGAAPTVEGRLTAPGGTPIAGAQIEVSELPAYAGAPAHALPTPRTGPAGRWSLALPREISSGVLRFAYRSRLGASLPIATRTLTLSVRAGVALGIAPRVASADGEIRFAGQLLGAPIPTGGKQLVLEARSPGGRWVEFHVIRAAASGGGHFHYAYRFHLPGPVRYQFRVLSEAEADYPFAAGSSNVVVVYER
ncbi:MAG TPA: hypothetical protein VK756_08875 [Solirubrobacteraceae bacterium]|jgi:hypothetical protein|nr:hypothetical protein [Solirubrobacteraceae bacterium]